MVQWVNSWNAAISELCGNVYNTRVGKIVLPSMSTLNMTTSIGTVGEQRHNIRVMRVIHTQARFHAPWTWTVDQFLQALTLNTWPTTTALHRLTFYPLAI